MSLHPTRTTFNLNKYTLSQCKGRRSRRESRTYVYAAVGLCSGQVGFEDGQQRRRWRPSRIAALSSEVVGLWRVRAKEAKRENKGLRLRKKSKNQWCFFWKSVRREVNVYVLLLHAENPYIYVVGTLVLFGRPRSYGGGSDFGVLWFQEGI
ncbi:unnamed protein product [Vicia faba]|uniref:Uncharacterized protein n=1 Tax=Vicia faba TaxID=3906 RepID=A0AAV1BE09_VICFA|nr:unnamed protein product [Vicia faba]